MTGPLKRHLRSALPLLAVPVIALALALSQWGRVQDGGGVAGALRSDRLATVGIHWMQKALPAEWEAGAAIGRAAWNDAIAACGLDAALLGETHGARTATTGTTARRARIVWYEGRYFDLAGVQFAFGRMPGAARDGRYEAVVSHAFAQQRFGSAEQAPGRHVRITANGMPSHAGVEFEIVGVVAKDYRGLGFDVPADVWLPLAHWPDTLVSDAIAGGYERTEAAYALDTTAHAPDAAAACLNAAAERGQWWSARRGTLRVLPGVGLPFTARERIVETIGLYRVLLVLLAGVVALTLLLDRVFASVQQGRDDRIRAAVGERPLRLLRRVFARNAVLLCAAVACGAALQPFVLHRLARLERFDLHPGAEAIAQGLAGLPVAAFIALIAAMLLLAAVPAALSAASVHASHASALLARWRPLDRLTVVLAAVAFVCAALASAMAWIGHADVARMQRRDLGFARADIVAFDIARTDDALAGLLARLGDPRPAGPLREAIAAALADLPHAVAAFDPVSADMLFDLVLPAPDGVAERRIAQAVGHVDPDYFELLAIPLRAGLSMRDATGAHHVWVNQAFVDAYLRDAAPIGMRLRIVDIHALAERGSTAPVALEIAGVVGDAHYLDVRGAATPMVYRRLERAAHAGTILVRVPQERIGAVRERLVAAVQRIDPAWTIDRVRGLDAVVADRLGPELRRLALVQTICGALLLFAVLGAVWFGRTLYAQRTFEIAMRRALGASKLAALLGAMPRGGGALLAVAVVSGALLAPPCVRAAFPAAPIADVLAIYAGIVVLLAVVIGALFVGWTLAQDERRLVEALRGE